MYEMKCVQKCFEKVKFPYSFKSLFTVFSRPTYWSLSTTGWLEITYDYLH